MTQKINLAKNVHQKNQEIADKLRDRFRQSNVTVLNLISSPGSGKTSLIEQMASHFKDSINMFVIDGDVETEHDADRLRKRGIDAVQIQTHGSCHLDADRIENVLNNVNLDNIDLLVIENIGNLICPTGFDLGESIRIVIASTAEGDDKPLKYPAAYRRANVCILNKIDLLDYVDFDLQKFESAARQTNPDLAVFHSSCTTARGIDTWCQWLKTKLHF